MTTIIPSYDDYSEWGRELRKARDAMESSDKMNETVKPDDRTHQRKPLLTKNEILERLHQSRNLLLMTAEDMSAHGHPGFTVELRKINERLDKLWREWYEVTK